MGPYAGVDYDLTSCPLQSRLQHIYYGQPFDRFDPLTLCQRRLNPLVGYFEFGLGVAVSFLLALGQNRLERKWETSFPDTEHQFSQLGRWKNQFLAMRCWWEKTSLKALSHEMHLTFDDMYG